MMNIMRLERNDFSAEHLTMIENILSDDNNDDYDHRDIV